VTFNPLNLEGNRGRAAVKVLQGEVRSATKRSSERPCVQLRAHREHRLATAGVWVAAATKPSGLFTRWSAFHPVNPRLLPGGCGRMMGAARQIPPDATRADGRSQRGGVWALRFDHGWARPLPHTCAAYNSPLVCPSMPKIPCSTVTTYLSDGPTPAPGLCINPKPEVSGT
jgi:hypothetical protein